jgi:UDP-N-acetylmuramyl tripeptide synthase
VILALEPRALARFSLGRCIVLVSGTNGKTTTTRLLAKALVAASGQEVLTNLSGANLPTGLATALAAGAGAGDSRLLGPAVLEVDEAWLPRVAEQVAPAVVVMLNLSRDQLDRNNEVRQVARRWREASGRLPAGSVVVANADDPLVAWAAMGAKAVIWAGAGMVWTGDATGCPECGGSLRFEERPIGTWSCADCGLARPEPNLWLETQDGAADVSIAAREAAGGLSTVPWGAREPGAWPRGKPLVVESSGAVHDVALKLPGRANMANALMALATLEVLGYAGRELDEALDAIAAVADVAGRYATVEHAGTVARLLLAKNPAGWAEVFGMLTPAPTPVVVAINARTADGHDPSWLWDVPFERLRGRRVVATGERYLDLAVRLHYAEVEHAKEPGLLEALVAAGPGTADVVANYTAFHQLLAALKRAGA